MKKIALVVDDDPANRSLMAEILDSMGLDVCTAENGLAALRATQNTNFDLVICDNQMPKMSGFEFYTALLRENPELARRFIFASATVNIESIAKDCPVLPKPFSIEGFKQTVESALA